MSMAQKNPSGAIRLGSRRANSLAAASSDAAVKTARRSNLKSGGQLRHSCDVCTNRKRTCDGDGVNRCSFCVAQERPGCHYGVRLLSGPRAGSASKRPTKEEPVPGKAANANCAPSTRSGDGSGGSSGLVSLRRYSSVLPLKRARLSPSPATGLVGLKENFYIAEYFRTMGFLPCTSESFIRKAMVRTMFSAAQENDPGLPGCSAGGGFRDEGEEKGGMEDSIMDSIAGLGGPVESAADSCVFWCTVAVGCLIGGLPKLSVDVYARLAREALSGCFDDGGIHSARAFTAMALLQDFRGDERKFSKYIHFAKSILEALPADEVPTDLADTHLLFKACDMFDGLSDQQLGEEDVQNVVEAMSSSSKEPRPILQAELCRWLLQTDVRLLACFSVDMHNHEVEAESAPAAGSDGGGYNKDLSPKSPPHAMYDELPGPGAGLDTLSPSDCGRRPLSGTAAEPPPPGPMSQKFAAQMLPDVKWMMDVAQSPEVRGGVGEFYFWMIMGYVCLLQGQPTYTVYGADGVLRCTDIFVQNPGFCRFTSWKHLAHCCLAFMAISDNSVKYEELRASYNSIVDNKSQEAPPFEEFRGMDCICGNTFCKSLYNFMTPEKQPPHDCDGASSTSEDESKRCPPKIELQDVETTSSSSEASNESWSRGFFDKPRQPRGMERGSREAFPLTVSEAPAAAPAAAAAALGLVGAFGGIVGNEQYPRHTGFEFSLGQGAGSVPFMTATTISRDNSSSSSTGPASAGGAAAVAAAPWTAAGRKANRPSRGQQGHRAGDGVTPFPLLLPLPLPSAQTRNTAPGPAKAGGNGGCNGGLDLLGTSQWEGPEATDLLHAVDEFLGDSIVGGFVGGAGNEDMLSFF